MRCAVEVGSARGQIAHRDQVRYSGWLIGLQVGPLFVFAVAEESPLCRAPARPALGGHQDTKGVAIEFSGTVGEAGSNPGPPTNFLAREQGICNPRLKRDTDRSLRVCPNLFNIRVMSTPASVFDVFAGDL